MAPTAHAAGAAAGATCVTGQMQRIASCPGLERSRRFLRAPRVRSVVNAGHDRRTCPWRWKNLCESGQMASSGAMHPSQKNAARCALDKAANDTLGVSLAPRTPPGCGARAAQTRTRSTPQLNADDARPSLHPAPSAQAVASPAIPLLKLPLPSSLPPPTAAQPSEASSASGVALARPFSAPFLPPRGRAAAGAAAEGAAAPVQQQLQQRPASAPAYKVASRAAASPPRARRPASAASFGCRSGEQTRSRPRGQAERLRQMTHAGLEFRLKELEAFVGLRDGF
eukprot:TRINITY_DN12434_c0_g2_i1.p1 TRINITY_DN12434_c0_g2~~TRINITY_DN12434_c0_g2_i1.p1  ORF type:complete len:283 (+),score=68.72 TRINITY_DN12434_c0_g2_i1:100-948(+)